MSMPVAVPVFKDGKQVGTISGNAGWFGQNAALKASIERNLYDICMCRKDPQHRYRQSKMPFVEQIKKYDFDTVETEWYGEKIKYEVRLPDWVE